MEIKINEDTIKKICEDLELGLVVWRENPDNPVYQNKLNRLRELEIAISNAKSKRIK